MRRRKIQIGIALVLSAGLSALVGSGSVGAEVRPPWSPPTIDPANFVRHVTNPYLPLKPGTTLLYRGVLKDGTTPQVDEFSVTNRRKLVMGVRCTVVRDTVSSRGRPVERTFDWFAQDRQGNVWYMGEETQELKNGHFGKMIDSGPAGVDGALPGIMMEARPQEGDAYWQFHWPGHALDYARVLGGGGTVQLPYGTFHHTLLTQEQSPLEPGVRDHKWSARGIGYVEERAASGSKEQIDLVRITHR
jgi:hypothetical protein